jgi:hypothetical protein
MKPYLATCSADFRETRLAGHLQTWGSGVQETTTFTTPLRFNPPIPFYFPFILVSDLARKKCT